MAYQVDTDCVNAKDRVDYWREVICDQFVPLNVAPQDGPAMTGRLTATSIGPLEVRDLGATPHQFNRTAPLIRRSPEDYFKIGIMERGRSLWVQDGREAVLDRGDFVLYDSTRPYSVVMGGPFRLTVCMLPKRLLPLRASELREVTAVRMSGNDGAGALVRPFLRELTKHAAEYHQATSDSLALSVAELITAVVRSRPEFPMHDLDQVNPLLSQVRTYIDDHIADRDLSPHSVAAAASISVSYLHKLFSYTDTTVAGYVREQRLQGCWRDLQDRNLDHLTITAIGARWGLPDPAHLSRLFKSRFGMTPQDCRHGLAGAVTIGKSW